MAIQQQCRTAFDLVGCFAGNLEGDIFFDVDESVGDLVSESGFLDDGGLALFEAVDLEWRLEAFV